MSYKQPLIWNPAGGLSNTTKLIRDIPFVLVKTDADPL